MARAAATKGGLADAFASTRTSAWIMAALHGEPAASRGCAATARRRGCSARAPAHTPIITAQTPSIFGSVEALGGRASTQDPLAKLHHEWRPDCGG